MNRDNRGWVWAYRKARSYHLSVIHALYRATRFMLFGNTGAFPSHGGWRKTRITRK